MSSTQLPRAIMKGLACAALNPSLRSILVFDASHETLTKIAEVFADLLATATRRKVEHVPLGITSFDDDLWGHFALGCEADSLSPYWRLGILAASPDDPHLRLIVISDLAMLNLASTRACVTLIGADVAHLERHGQQRLWQPNICWLASCARSEVGHLSPHLLDRFSLRLHWPDTDSTSFVHRSDLFAHIPRDISQTEAFDEPYLIAMREQIQQVACKQAILSEDAISSIFEYKAISEVFSFRRAIALARLASALAQLENESNVGPTHVAAAALLIGLPTSDRPSLKPQYPSREVFPQERPPLEESPSDPLTHPPAGETLFGKVRNGICSVLRWVAQMWVSCFSTSPKEERQPATNEVYTPAVPKEQEYTPITLYPYPEDHTDVERESASLQLPLLRFPEARPHQGRVIGVERTNTLHDLAITSTIFAAAPFQRIRYESLRKQLAVRQERTLSPLDLTKRPFLLNKSDLRRYRRAPIANLLLLLVLDYTSLHHCNWQASLRPYLDRAYRERASIYIVQIGHAGASNELRAEIIKARNILVPSVDKALTEARGRATPLAHGLDLALQTLSHALQHGRSTVQRVLLVVISDGRGNVPLEASYAGNVTHPVSRQGIEDALSIAQQLQDCKKTEKILLNPQSKICPDLPLLFAETMAAEIKAIPSRTKAEE